MFGWRAELERRVEELERSVERAERVQRITKMEREMGNILTEHNLSPKKVEVIMTDLGLLVNSYLF